MISEFIDWDLKDCNVIIKDEQDREITTIRPKMIKFNFIPQDRGDGVNWQHVELKLIDDENNEYIIKSYEYKFIERGHDMTETRVTIHL